MEKRINYEPMCETSEPGERLMQKAEILPASLEVGRRILEVFGYQPIAQIVFRLRSNADEVNAVINGECLPRAEMLMGIRRITGASIDWILTGQGVRFVAHPEAERTYDSLPLAVLATRRERQPAQYFQPGVSTSQ